MPRKGARSTQAGRVRNNNNIRNLVTQQEIRGSKLNGPADPPSINSRPWYPHTTKLVGLGAGTTSVQTILTALKNQLGLLDAERIEIRILKIRSWCPVNDPEAQFKLSFYDFTKDVVGTELPVYSTINDVSGRDRYAHVGYKYPLTIAQSLPYDNATIVYNTTVTTDTPSLDYIYLLWRVQAPQPDVKARLTNINY